MNEKSYIYANKYKSSFPAILKMADGTVLENGQAMVSVENRAVDFISDFVPLFTMGTPLEIVRVFRNKEIQSFLGAVYLSSEKLLRITSVKDTLMEGTEKFYIFPVEETAQIQVLSPPEPSPAKGRLRLRRRKAQPAPEQELFTIHVTGIAIDAVEFTTPVQLPAGQQLLLTMQDPFPLEKVSLEVKRILQFGLNGQNYFCRVLSLPKLLRSQWEEFIHALHLKTNKYF